MNLILGRSKSISRINAFIKKIAPARSTVLIEGESGTGKELAAQAIHHNSLRCNMPFVAVNCGAIPDNLIESEFFGYEKGAFTGAFQTRCGRVEMAKGGTLFLDEIGELPPAGQVKLLRIIQERRFERVGSTRPISADVRIVAATHRDLRVGIRDGWFREDLYYRLNVIRIPLPPLREHKEDIPLLVEHFIDKYAAENHKRVLGISPGALDLLKQYEYRGNVRELENMMEKTVVLLEGGIIRRADIKKLFNEPGEGITDACGGLPVVKKRKLLLALQRITLVSQNGKSYLWYQSLRKIPIHSILQFLISTEGEEFTRKSFTNHLNDHMKKGKLSYKTTGEYIKILKDNNICRHNNAHANKSRYRLSQRFVSKSPEDCLSGYPPLPCVGGICLQRIGPN